MKPFFYYFDNDEGLSPPPGDYALLLENGGFLLQENGGLILLENGPVPFNGDSLAQENISSLILQEDGSRIFLEQ